MSFKQRLVMPIFVSRVKVDKIADDELEWVANHTMANIIIQLSSLARHAEDLFADLCRSTASLNQRAANLNAKISQVAEKVSQFDPTEEEVLLHEVQKRSQYKSTEEHDQQVVSRITMSQAIQDLYNMCARPPPLDKLNMYRDDGKDCMKYYTDPSYFFQLWLLSIQEDIEKKKDQKKKRKTKKQKRTVQVKPKNVTSTRERNKHRGMGAEFVNDVEHKIPNKGAAHGQNQQTTTANGDFPPPTDLDPTAADNNYPPPPPVINQYSFDEDLPPPPPPPPFEENQSAPPPPPPLIMGPQGTPTPPPLMATHRPAPPPPPTANGATAPPPPPPLVVGTVPQNTQVIQKPDRGDLLSQIRDGNKILKKTEERQHQEKPQDVHSMMTQLFVARRQALEDSDSNDDGDYDDDDDDDWDDD